MIQALWDHILLLWQYWNDALHENDTKKVAQFRVEAMDRDIKCLEVRNKDLIHKLRTFQDEHMQRVEHVKTLQHNSRKCWASLAKVYLDEAENRIETDIQLMDQYLQGRLSIIPRAYAPGIVAPGLLKPMGFQLVSCKRN
jgi:hypothetical protein